MAVEIHEDQPLVEPSVAWIRQFWAPMITQKTYTNSSFHPAIILNTENANATYLMPTDFTALVSLTIMFFCGNTGNKNIQVSIWFAGCGEAWNTHLGVQAFAVPLVNGIFYCLDLVPIFGALLANLVAGDLLWVELRNQSANAFQVYGVDGRYT